MPHSIPTLILLSQGAFVLTSLVLARVRRAEDPLVSTFWVLAAATFLIWGPVVALWLLTQRFVLKPLRLTIEGDAERSIDDQYDNDFRGMRKIKTYGPLLATGVYRFKSARWEPSEDGKEPHDACVEFHQTNRFLLLGYRKVGITIIRHGEPVDLPPKAKREKAA